MGIMLWCVPKCPPPECLPCEPKEADYAVMPLSDGEAIVRALEDGTVSFAVDPKAGNVVVLTTSSGRRYFYALGRGRFVAPEGAKVLAGAILAVTRSPDPKLPPAPPPPPPEHPLLPPAPAFVLPEIQTLAAPPAAAPIIQAPPQAGFWRTFSLTVLVGTVAVVLVAALWGSPKPPPPADPTPAPRPRRRRRRRR